jgi:hypothetical protein
VNTGQGTLLMLMVSLVRVEDAEQARGLAGMLAAPIVNLQATRASNLTAEVTTELRLYKRTMEEQQVFDFADDSIPTVSSGESSNGSNENEGKYEIQKIVMLFDVPFVVVLLSRFEFLNEPSIARKCKIPDPLFIKEVDCQLHCLRLGEVLPAIIDVC